MYISVRYYQPLRTFDIYVNISLNGRKISIYILVVNIVESTSRCESTNISCLVKTLKTFFLLFLRMSNDEYHKKKS